MVIIPLDEEQLVKILVLLHELPQSVSVAGYLLGLQSALADHLIGFKNPLHHILDEIGVIEETRRDHKERYHSTSSG